MLIPSQELFVQSTWNLNKHHDSKKNVKVYSHFYKNENSRNYINWEITNESDKNQHSIEKNADKISKYLKNLEYKNKEEITNQNKLDSYIKQSINNYRKISMKREKEYMDLHKFK